MLANQSLLATCLVLTCCCGGQPRDNADDSFLGEGKADDLGIVDGSPEAFGVLRLVNLASLDQLDHEARLDSRAAGNIVAYRQGDDRISGTDDDEVFDTLAELDAVKYVGPRAFARLLTYALENGYVKNHRLDIATFNIRWYGLNGSFYGTFGSETRDDTIREFLKEHLGGSDVIIFQEIVDVERFLTNIADQLSCSTYDSNAYKHQHVVLCTTSRYRLDIEADDDNHAYEALRDGNLRPGVHGRLHDLETGTYLAHFLGVHLKARPDSTDCRLTQTEIIAERLEQLAFLDDQLPLLVFGDFNTHWARDTGLDQDDYLLMDEIYREHPGIDVKHVDYPGEHSFRNKSNIGYKLDRLWVSSTVDVVDIAVRGPCNLDWETGADPIVEHHDQVSDHCPVLAELHF